MGEPVWCEVHHRLECCHKSKRSHERCHGAACSGLDSCYQHAGSRTRVLAGKVLAAKHGHWQPIKIHPAEALLEEVWHWTGLCAWLDGIVAGLQEGEMTWGLSRMRTVSGPDGQATVAEQAAALNTWVAWQESAHREKAKVARMALEGDAEARMLGLAEAWAARSIGTYEELLGLLELTEHQWELAREHLPKLLERHAA